MPERSKDRFKTARSAWQDIAEDTGLKPNQVESDHDRTKWRWNKK